MITTTTITYKLNKQGHTIELPPRFFIHVEEKKRIQ